MAALVYAPALAAAAADLAAQPADARAEAPTSSAGCCWIPAVARAGRWLVPANLIVALVLALLAYRRLGRLGITGGRRRFWVAVVLAGGLPGYLCQRLVETRRAWQPLPAPDKAAAPRAHDPRPAGGASGLSRYIHVCPNDPGWLVVRSKPSFSSTRTEAAFTSSTPAMISANPGWPAGPGDGRPGHLGGVAPAGERLEQGVDQLRVGVQRPASRGSRRSPPARRHFDAFPRQPQPHPAAPEQRLAVGDALGGPLAAGTRCRPSGSGGRGHPPPGDGSRPARRRTPAGNRGGGSSRDR